MKNLFTIVFWLSTVMAIELPAQNGIIKGFVYDAEKGEPLARVAVIIKGSYLGSSTDENGFFSIRNVQPGKHTIEARNLAFFTEQQLVELKPQETVSLTFQMRSRVLNIDEATISAKKQMYQERNVSSVHRLTPATMDRIPSMQATPDLAEYLQVIPGIITTGDKGGQLYIRGGTPVQNLTLLDGMTIINPFHSIGFVSVFDTDVIQTVDVFTSGFGARYGGRVSSVIDIKTRAGNRNNFSGKASASTFGYNFLFEGPLKKMTEKDPSSTSILLSNKRSYLDATQPLMAPFLDSLGMPFSYNDVFGKYTFRNNEGDQFDFSMIHFKDRASYGGFVESTWQNTGARAKYVYSPRMSSSLWESQIAFSEYRGELQEENLRPRETRYGSVDVHLSNSFTSEIFDWRAGFGFTTYATSHDFLSLDSLVVQENLYTMDTDLYYESKIKLKRLTIEPGLHMRLFTNFFRILFEPRLRARYTLNEYLSLNMSAGIYSQELISTIADEDVIKVFQGFKIGVSSVQEYYFGEREGNHIQRARHFATGLQWLPNENFRMTAEVYLKDFYRLLNFNRNKVYPDKKAFKMVPEILRKDYVFERGWAYGMDVLLDYTKSPFSFWMAYSLGFVNREDEVQVYSPHFDRRHNLNLIGGLKFGKNLLYDLKVRWNIGSGFPFTQSYGVFENLTLYGMSTHQDVTANGTAGIWYGPLNEGRLPWYHRLDISVHRDWELPKGRTLSGSIGVINAYNRANVYYFDRIEYERVNQYPIMPGFGLVLNF